MAKNQPIAITTGDHRGIGAEVISKGLHLLNKKIKPHEVIIFGASELYKPFKRHLGGKVRVWRDSDVFKSSWNGPEPGSYNFVETGDKYSCGRYIELATKGAISGLFSAVTTGPIDKNELHRDGYLFDGHTEMLQSLCKSSSVTMMMSSPQMRTTLVTTHEPISAVSSALTQAKILKCIENTVVGLTRNFGIKSPRIAVLGLNPHAGDKGLFGNEEIKIISPAVKQSKALHPKASIDGPFPPDGFFAQWKTRHFKAFDAVVCMYHDQGLIPIKLLDFKNTVNVTLGLPIIRTSVDHGIGLDIAGKNKADPSSFCAALTLARSFVKISKKG